MSDAFHQQFPISDREREEMEVKLHHAQLRDLSAASLACTVKNYYDALKISGFSDEEAIDLVKSTVHYLLR
jgi:hypothetical protein